MESKDLLNEFENKGKPVNLLKKFWSSFLAVSVCVFIIFYYNGTDENMVNYGAAMIVFNCIIIVSKFDGLTIFEKDTNNQNTLNNERKEN